MSNFSQNFPLRKKSGIFPKTCVVQFGAITDRQAQVSPGTGSKVSDRRSAGDAFPYFMMPLMDRSQSLSISSFLIPPAILS